MKDDYYWRLRVRPGKKYDPGQPRVPAGDPRGGQWTSGQQIIPIAAQTEGARPVSDRIDVDSLPKPLAEIAKRAWYYPVNFTGILEGVGGVAAWRQKDGSWKIGVAAGRKPSPFILVHEIVHGHQSQMTGQGDYEQHERWYKKFQDAARQDNDAVKPPLWGRDYLEEGAGDEIWASAAGWYYGGSRGLLERGSPRVVSVIKELYEGISE